MPAADDLAPLSHPVPSPPPAWGMGDDARPGSGSPRRVGVSIPHVDAVLTVLALLIWTAVFVFFFAPR
jgi:hypothetical protein